MVGTQSALAKNWSYPIVKVSCNCLFEGTVSDLHRMSLFSDIISSVNLKKWYREAADHFLAIQKTPFTDIALLGR